MFFGHELLNILKFRTRSEIPWASAFGAPRPAPCALSPVPRAGEIFPQYSRNFNIQGNCIMTLVWIVNKDSFLITAIRD